MFRAARTRQAHPTKALSHPRRTLHPMDIRQTAPGGPARLAAQVPLRNAHPVPPGVHHDVQHPIPVTVTLRWETGDEQLETIALEWTQRAVRVRIADPRVMTGAIWLPAGDVRRR